MLMCVILSVSGCGGNSWVDDRLNEADRLMESHPDSALSIIDSIPTNILEKEEQKARYSLLKSMALDKNLIDKSTFEVLQPAIDYYAEKGTPDEKLRAYYYQGRIYENRNERDSALRLFMRGLDIAEECHDSMTIARTLVAEGIIYYNFYDINGYVDSYLKAADIYNSKSCSILEFDCLLNALNGLVILSNREKADSVMKILGVLDSMDEYEKQTLQRVQFSYVVNFGSLNDIKDFLKNGDKSSYDSNGILNLARAYNKIGLQDSALMQIKNLDKMQIGYDSLKYLLTKYRILEDSGNYKEALSVYKDCVSRLDVINSSKFEQKSRSMEERHRIELDAERDAEKIKKLIWVCIGGLVFLVMATIIFTLLMRRNKIKKNLALQQVRNAELENARLKAENALAIQKARTAELENASLLAENRNLQLERDNKALEAENLAHRVAELESESDNLRELLQSQDEMPEEVRKAIKTRIEMLNSYLASQISDHKEFEKAYDTWVSELTANTQEFMDSNRLAFQASHPAFIKYFEDHGLTESEINYVCLYAIGLRGKDVGNYMRKRSHVNISSTIRKKLGIDKHDTNIGIYVRKLLKGL